MMRHSFNVRCEDFILQRRLQCLQSTRGHQGLLLWKTLNSSLREDPKVFFKRSSIGLLFFKKDLKVHKEFPIENFWKLFLTRRPPKPFFFIEDQKTFFIEDQKASFFLKRKSRYSFFYKIHEGVIFFKKNLKIFSFLYKPWWPSLQLNS